MRDAHTLLQWSSSSSSGVTIIDLRNADEIERGAKERTEGAQCFYRQPAPFDTINEHHHDHQQQLQNSLIHIPILRNVDAFWDEAISRMPVQERVLASLLSTFQGRALDQAAARHMEQGGHVALNTIMLASCGSAIRKALDVCLVKSATATTSAETAAVNDNNTDKKDSPGHPLVLFHCQKGKDRTGMLAMLLQHCMGDSESEIIHAYGRSGALLGEDETSSNNMAATSSAGLVDWSYFRGSPESAMRNTLLWIQATYGSMDGYLNSIGFSNSQRRRAIPSLHTTTKNQ
jgi:Tyrosine phosphatase family